MAHASEVIVPLFVLLGWLGAGTACVRVQCESGVCVVCVVRMFVV